MLIRLLAVGDKMPSWVKGGIEEYAKRFSRSLRFQIIEIPAEKRTKPSHALSLMQREGEKILSFTLPDHLIVALERGGDNWSTETLSQQLNQWQQTKRGVDFLIGGPEGLSPACLKHAHHHWSLSALTLPHPLVRIIVVEQLYRADSILNHHPYHR